MKRVVADANIFLRFLLNDIPSQQKLAAKLLQNAKDRKIELIIPQIIIFEINFILTKYYLLSKKEVVSKLKSILGAPYLDVQDKDIFQRALDIYKDKNLSLADCFLVAKSEFLGAKIFTFDKTLQKISV